MEYGYVRVSTKEQNEERQLVCALRSEDFAALHRAWREKHMTLREAADACGMPKSTFYDAALQVEAAAGRI